MMCPYCKDRPLPAPDFRNPTPAHCGVQACRLAHRRQRDMARKNRDRADERARTAVTIALARVATVPRGLGVALAGWRESADSIDRRFAEARAARLAEERRNGQRRYTITDGWDQKPGRSTLDGEWRALEMGE